MKRKRKKDALSLQYSNCYTADELLLYGTGGLPKAKRGKIFHHLNVERCERCRHIFHMLGHGESPDESSHVREEMIQRLKNTRETGRKYATPLKIERGQIWTTTPRPKDAEGKTICSVDVAFPVLLVSSGNGKKVPHNIIRVIPVSFDTDYEFAGETIVLEHGPLMYPVLLEMFNERPMLAGNLDEYRGSVSSHDLARILDARDQFLEGDGTKPDEEYLAWKEKEIEMAEYLSLPVNAALWQEDDRDQTVDIPVSAYRKAADTSKEELSDISPHVLLETDEIALGIVQIRDRFLLRIVADDTGEKPLPRILVNSRTVSLEKRGPGVYEALLGYGEQMTGTMELQAEIGEEHHVFHLRFRGKGEPA